MWDALWTNANLATMAGHSPFGLIEHGAVAVQSGRIVWIGPAASLPGAPQALARTVHDIGGRVVTPGLVDAHTHIVHYGTSVDDFELLIRNATREELRAAGGGVRRTLWQTRAASDEQLYDVSSARVRQLIAAGVTTVESKSGYGLDRETELRQMRISRQIGRDLPITVVSTFLGAHGLAPEYEGQRDAYTDFLCDDVLPTAVHEGIVDMVDAFCDYDGFTHAQTARMYEAAKSHGLPVVMHADQYSDFGAGALAARFGAYSAAHLEYANEDTVRAMADAGTIAMVLPGANWQLGETRRPPIDWFRQYGVRIGAATNNNPTSSPCLMPTQIMHMACRMFGLTTEEAVACFTSVGGAALGLDNDRGTLEVGKLADLVVWDVPHPAELPYRIAYNPCSRVIKGGVEVYAATPVLIREQVTA